MRNKVTTLSLAALLVACTPHNKKDCPTSTYELSLGDRSYICQLNGINIEYAGMPSDKAFSLGVGYENSRINYFFPVEPKKFTLNKTDFRVDSVSPEKIKFTYVEDKN